MGPDPTRRLEGVVRIPVAPTSTKDSALRALGFEGFEGLRFRVWGLRFLSGVLVV